MLARAGSIHHPSGQVIRTPLLVPSFSSKGFRVTQAGKAPELLELFCWGAEFLTDSCLLSAFDMYYGLCPRPEDMPLNLNLTIIDSGGYEISDNQDLSSVYSAPVRAQDWDRDKLREVLDRWPADRDSVFVSFDHPVERYTFDEQVEHAAKFANSYRHQLHALLLKPETKEQSTLREVLKHAVADPESLARFHIVGVTEKELGTTTFERMKRIATLRQALDNAKITTPIHVFGSLDPISVQLYYVSGAEIFDGLTWLRYGYHDNICVYRYDCGLIKYGLNTHDNHLRSHIMSDNINYLTELTEDLRVFAHRRDFARFGRHEEFIRRASEQLEAHLS